jgi:integrase
LLSKLFLYKIIYSNRFTNRYCILLTFTESGAYIFLTEEIVMNEKKKLTDALVSKLKDAPKGTGYYYIWDTDLKGFALRVTEKGTKSYIIIYRNDEGRQKVMTLFRADKITAQDARNEAKVKLGSAQSGTDHLKEKQEKKEALLFSELVDKYLELYAVKENKPSTVKTNKSYIRRFLLPAFGNKPVAGISREDVARLHVKLIKTPYQANRVYALLNKIFLLAEEWGYRPLNSNPCAYIRKYKEYARERYLTAEELMRLNQVLDKYEEKHYSAVTAIRLLLLTGCRKGEILTLKWEDIKERLKVLDLKDSKTGAKKVPISDKVLETLEDTLKVNEFVCFGRKENSCLVGLQKIWEKFRSEIGLEDVRIHDLRHSFASSAISNGISLEYLSKLLGHANFKTTERYAHLTLEPLHEAANKIAASITTASKTGKNLRRVK